MKKKVLIVNNYTKRIDEVVSLFQDCNVKVVDLDDFNFKDFQKGYDGYVLTGGIKYSILEHAENYSEVISLIENTTKPLLGISLGFELIGYTYDEDLNRAVGFGSGIRQIKVKEEDPILYGVDSHFVAAEAHKWYFDGLRKLKILASSQRGIEVARHPEKKIYGVQFHPEIDIGDHNPIKIVENFIKLL